MTTTYPYQCTPYLAIVAQKAGYTHLQIIHHDDGPVGEQWQIRARWRLDDENPLRRGDEMYVLSMGGTFSEAYRRAFEYLGVEAPDAVPTLYTVEELSINRLEERDNNAKASRPAIGEETWV
jgi:hypothetical protein